MGSFKYSSLHCTYISLLRTFICSLKFIWLHLQAQEASLRNSEILILMTLSLNSCLIRSLDTIAQTISQLKHKLLVGFVVLTVVSMEYKHQRWEYFHKTMVFLNYTNNVLQYILIKIKPQLFRFWNNVIQKCGLGIWIGFIWLRIGTGGELLWTQWWASGSIKCGEFLD
jgi:hypothetical protein